MRYRRLRIDGATYFFTVVAYERQPLFREAWVVALLLEAIERVGKRHPFDLVAQVVMPDHLHSLWTLPPGDASFSTRWRLIKETFTREYSKGCPEPTETGPERVRNRHRLWQPRFWEHFIRDDRDFAAHLDYIHLNPVHHGFVAAPRDWPHSTFQTWVERGTYDANWGSGEKPELPEWARRHE